MKILISAGEASGDMHAGAITKAIKQLDATAQVYGMGGDLLRAAGGNVLFDIKEHGVMGFVEIIKRLPKLYKLKKDFVQLMQDSRPDCFVTVDYPGLNMRLAKAAHKLGIPVVCYIPPSAWAWNRGRAKKVAAFATQVAAVFPFEYDVYKEAGADTVFVGHPLVDIVKPQMTQAEAMKWAGKREGHPLILLIPGSRLMEVKRMLPVLLKAAKILQLQRPELDFVMPRADTVPMEMLEYEVRMSGMNVKICQGNNYDLFSVADLALATSGTVTLEAALLGLGSVILYKTGWLNAFIARLVLNIPYIGLPNIVAGRLILPELLQGDCNSVKLADTALSLLEQSRYAKMKDDLSVVKQKMGGPGAVGRVAKLILQVAGEKK